MEKVALVVFNGELMCFTHVMLYAREFFEKGYEVRIVLEGSATKLPGQLAGPEAPFAELYKFVKEKGLIGCVCKACSIKMGANEEVEKEGLALNGELNGHPSMEKLIKEGFQVLTF